MKSSTSATTPKCLRRARNGPSAFLWQTESSDLEKHCQLQRLSPDPSSKTKLTVHRRRWLRPGVSAKVHQGRRSDLSLSRAYAVLDDEADPMHVEYNENYTGIC
ncbi:hypothetical protein VTO42DRAFT_5077 [Malbranchea cinnamomea]